MTPSQYITDLLNKHRLINIVPPEFIGELVQLKIQADLATVMTEKYLRAVNEMDPEYILKLKKM